MDQAIGEGNLEQRIEADLAFHRTCVASPATTPSCHSWEGLEGSIRMSIMFAGLDRAVGNMDVARHDAIVDAIETGDPDAAATAVQKHMAWAANNLGTTPKPEAPPVLDNLKHRQTGLGQCPTVSESTRCSAPVSSAVMAAISSAVSTKSKMSRFWASRAGCDDRGRAQRRGRHASEGRPGRVSCHTARRSSPASARPAGPPRLPSGLQATVAMPWTRP